MLLLLPTVLSARGPAAPPTSLLERRLPSEWRLCPSGDLGRPLGVAASLFTRSAADTGAACRPTSSAAPCLLLSWMDPGSPATAGGPLTCTLGLHSCQGRGALGPGGRLPACACTPTPDMGQPSAALPATPDTALPPGRPRHTLGLRGAVAVAAPDSHPPEKRGGVGPAQLWDDLLGSSYTARQ